MNSVLTLGSNEKAFAQGGNRLCFFHPNYKDRCVKIVRPDRTPALRRKEKPFPKNLKPLSRFDENVNEFNEIQRIQSRVGDRAFVLISQCYGFINTDLGKGLCLELINDFDGKVSLSLKQYLWVNGFTDSLLEAFERFSIDWQEWGMPSRDLLLHNIVVQQSEEEGGRRVKRLVVIDGLGWSGIPVIYHLSRSYRQYKAKKKIEKLKRSMKSLLVNKENNADWGYHGWLKEEQRVNK